MKTATPPRSAYVCSAYAVEGEMIRRTSELVFLVGPVSTQATGRPDKPGRSGDTWYDMDTGTTYEFRRGRWARRKPMRPIKPRRQKRTPWRRKE